MLLVYFFFKDMICPETKRPFFAQDHSTRVVLELQYIAWGYLSYPPHHSMFVSMGKLNTGFEVFRTLASSSPLEGYHQHLNDAVTVQSKIAGLRYTEAVTNEFDWQWVGRALKQVGLVPKSIHHFNFALVDELYANISKLFGQDKVKKMLDGWRRTPSLTVPAVQHGVAYALQIRKKQLLESGAKITLTPSLNSKNSPGELQWVSNQLGSPVKLRRNLTREDIAAVLPLPPGPLTADHLVRTPAQISTDAFNRGLLITQSDAEKLQDKVLMDQTAKNMLDANGYVNLQTTIRASRATQQQPAPQLSTSILPTVDPLLSLPGPQPGMPQAPRLPAIYIKPVDEEAGSDGGRNEGPKQPTIATKKQRQEQAKSCMKNLRKDPAYKQKEAEGARLRRAKKKSAMVYATAPPGSVLPLAEASGLTAKKNSRKRKATD